MSKTPNDYPLVKFRPAKLAGILAVRSEEQTDRGYSATAKQDLSDYYELLSLCLPALSEDEQLLLAHIVSGWIATPQTVHLLWAEVQDYLESANMSDPAFVERLRKLPRFECWALYNVISQE